MRKLLTLSLAVLFASTLGACQDQPTTPAPEATASHTPASSNAANQAFKAELKPLAGSGVHGTANFQLQADRLSVQLVARGLASGTHAQHIHENATCAEFGFGPVQVPLDFDLGDGDGAADGPFPSTSGNSGMLTYSQKARSEAFSELPLGEKTVVVHAALPDFTPVACGEIDPVRH